MTQKKSRLLFEKSPVGICTVDLLGNFVTTNSAYEKMLGYSKEELKGKSFFDVTHPEYRPKNKELFQKMFSLKSTGFKMEKKYIRKDGAEINVSVYATAVMDDKGETEFGTAFVEDITERIHAEEEQEKLQAQLTQAQRLESVGRLAGGVAHDFNNMLTIIIGYSESALAKLRVDDPLHGKITQILNAGTRSADITRQLLTFARKQTTVPKTLDLNDSIEGMLKMLRRLVGEDIDLAWRPGADVWPVKIDPSQIDQILANLCVNARDAIEDTGQVTIETHNISFDEEYCANHAGFIPGEYVMLGVSDSGSGMSPEVLDKIFEPFFTTKGLHQGTGLGLSTVHGIVHQNNGFINVYSEINQGTTIKCYFSRHAGEKDEMRLKNDREMPLSQGETILLVEDEKESHH
jgi:two-component system sensor histidine kinase EvgS